VSKEQISLTTGFYLKPGCQLGRPIENGAYSPTQLYILEVTVFVDVAPSSLAEIDRRFRDADSKIAT
jgi:hypothetical protein